MTKFAVIKTGGKQYKVSEGDVLSIEKLLRPGSGRVAVEGEATFDEVLLVAKGDDVKVGQPTVSGARVTAKVVETAKGDKKMVFRYKNKTRRRKKKGHRQQYTKVQILKISA